MKQNHLPYVNYTTFLSRVKNQRWNLYKAVHTPAKVHNRDRDRRRKARFSNVKDRISDFFRTLFNL